MANVGDMDFDGVDREPEPLSDQLYLQAVRDEQGDLALARGQSLARTVRRHSSSTVDGRPAASF